MSLKAHYLLAPMSLALLAVLTSRPALTQVSGSVPSYIKLQATTPGSAQTGHGHITGKLMAGGLDVFDNTNLGISLTGNTIAIRNLSEDTAYQYVSAPEVHQFFISGSVAMNISSTGIAGVGSGLTNLNASNVSLGTLNDARLSANVAKLNTINTWTATQSFISNIGVGSSPNGNKLHVSGDADVTGNLDASSVTINPTARVYTISAMDINQVSGTDPYFTSGLVTKFGGSAVHLPQGATITSIFLNAEDNASDDIVVELYRAGVDGSAGTVMASIDTTGNTPGVRVFTDSSIGLPVIDNDNFVYGVSVIMPAVTVGSAKFRSIRIKYTVDKPLP